MSKTNKPRVVITQLGDKFIGTLYTKTFKVLDTPRLNSKAEVFVALNQMPEYNSRPEFLTIQ